MTFLEFLPDTDTNVGVRSQKDVREYVYLGVLLLFGIVETVVLLCKACGCKCCSCRSHKAPVDEYSTLQDPVAELVND